MEVRSLAQGLWSSLPECGLVLGGAWGKLLKPSKPSLPFGGRGYGGLLQPRYKNVCSYYKS